MKTNQKPPVLLHQVIKWEEKPPSVCRSNKLLLLHSLQLGLHFFSVWVRHIVSVWSSAQQLAADWTRIACHLKRPIGSSPFFGAFQFKTIWKSEKSRVSPVKSPAAAEQTGTKGDAVVPPSSPAGPESGSGAHCSSWLANTPASQRRARWFLCRITRVDSTTWNQTRQRWSLKCEFELIQPSKPFFLLVVGERGCMNVNKLAAVALFFISCICPV